MKFHLTILAICCCVASFGAGRLYQGNEWRTAMLEANAGHYDAYTGRFMLGAASERIDMLPAVVMANSLPIRGGDK